jgi:hypothetical protein
MKRYGKYTGLLGGVLLALSGFLPLMSRKGISVNGFHPELGLQVGYGLLVVGLGLAAAGFLPGKWGSRPGWVLALLGIFLVFTTWWQGHKLHAVAWGIWLMWAGALLGVVAQVLRGMRGE